MRIEIPEFSLVVMIGADMSGKSSFANKHFLQTEILSIDFFRAVLSDNGKDPSVCSAAYEILYAAEM